MVTGGAALGSMASGSGSRAAKRSGRTADAEDLAIRFVNTTAWRLRDPVEERMPSPEALLVWLDRNKTRDATRLRELLLYWRRKPDVGQAALDAAITLREAIYVILTSRIKGAEPPKRALACLNRYLSQPSPRLRIAWEAGEPVWHLQSARPDATHLLMPVARSAAELMTGIRAHKVRQCQDDGGCGWLFVDESRAQNRRWCSMGNCGNRAKAHRHYRRMRSKAADGGNRT